ncbi:MAG: ATP-binding protein [Deltaproteobacteria bacterium]|nr:ATP-binding protein [Deltaproteobacteria bacterium]
MTKTDSDIAAAVLSEIGRLGFESADLWQFLDRSAEVLARDLGLARIAVLEAAPDGRTLRYLKGVGFPDACAAGAAVESAETVPVERADALVLGGPGCGDGLPLTGFVVVPIPGKDWNFGALAAEPGAGGAGRAVVRRVLGPAASAMGLALQGLQAEQALRHSKDRYEALSEGTAMGIWHVDLDGYTIYVNKAMLDMLEVRNAGALAGATYESFVAPESVNIVRSEQHKRSRGEATSYEIELVGRGGTRRNVVVTGVPLFTEDGNLHSLIGTFTDVTERERALQSLRAEKERLDVTLRGIGDGVIAVDLEDRIELMNEAAEQMTGWRQMNALGRALADVVRVADPMTRRPSGDLLRRIVESGDDDPPWTPCCSAAAARSGSCRAPRRSCTTTRAARRASCSCFATWAKRAAPRRRFSRRRNSNRWSCWPAGSRTTSTIFSPACSATYRSPKCGRRPAKKMYARLAEAEKAAQFARELTQQLLTFSKGGAPLKRAARVADILHDTVELTRSGSGVACEYDLPGDLRTVEIDTTQFGQVITNIALNAIQAMDGRGRLFVRAENMDIREPRSYGLPPGKYVRITIADEGPGIPKDRLMRIFDPYFTTKEEGSGLGLAIAHSVVKQHGGTISVDSEEGRGTTFVITIPASGTEFLRAMRSRPASQKQRRGRILVMDDDPVLLDSARAMLEEMGYEAVGTANGEEMIEATQQARTDDHRFDAYIVDLTIRGGMGGKKALEHLLEADPGAVAIVSSGRSTDPAMLSPARFGFKGVLKKPYRVDELAAELDRLLTPREKRRFGMMIHVIVTLAVLLAVASFAMAQGGPAEDEIDRDALYASVTKMLAETDTAAVVEHLQTLGEPNAAAMAWSKLVLDLYHKGKNLPAVVAIARAGTQYALAEARRVDATNPELAADLRSRGKAMAYNLASFTWPGWSAPGIEPTRGDMLIGLDAARVSLRLARELKKGPVPEVDLALGGRRAPNDARRRRRGDRVLHGSQKAGGRRRRHHGAPPPRRIHRHHAGDAARQRSRRPCVVRQIRDGAQGHRSRRRKILRRPTRDRREVFPHQNTDEQIITQNFIDFRLLQADNPVIF